jgi:hypothetical protein
VPLTRDKVMVSRDLLPVRGDIIPPFTRRRKRAFSTVPVWSIPAPLSRGMLGIVHRAQPSHVSVTHFPQQELSAWVPEPSHPPLRAPQRRVNHRPSDSTPRLQPGPAQPPPELDRLEHLCYNPPQHTGPAPSSPCTMGATRQRRHRRSTGSAGNETRRGTRCTKPYKRRHASMRSRCRC